MTTTKNLSRKILRGAPDDEKMSLYDSAVKRLEDDGDEIVALGAFDLLEGLNVIVFRPVHDGEDLGNKAVFVSGPLAGLTNISGFHNLRSFSVTGCLTFVAHRRHRLRVDKTLKKIGFW